MDATGTVESLTDDEDTNEREAEGRHGKTFKIFSLFSDRRTHTAHDGYLALIYLK
jgi:hypothetical protein